MSEDSVFHRKCIKLLQRRMSGRKKAAVDNDGIEYISSANDVEVSVIRSADAKTVKVSFV